MTSNSILVRDRDGVRFQVDGEVVHWTPIKSMIEPVEHDTVKWLGDNQWVGTSDTYTLIPDAHTTEPWHADGRFIKAANGQTVAEVFSPAEQRSVAGAETELQSNRDCIVQCVNACAPGGLVEKLIKASENFDAAHRQYNRHPGIDTVGAVGLAAFELTTALEDTRAALGIRPPKPVGTSKGR